MTGIIYKQIKKEFILKFKECILSKDNNPNES